MKDTSGVWTRIRHLAPIIAVAGFSAAMAHGAGGGLPPFFAGIPGGGPDGAAYTLRQAAATVDFSPRSITFRRGASSLSMEFQGAAATARLAGGRPQPGVVNYLSGAEPAAWRTHLPTYGSLSYHGLYPGVDLEYRVSAGELKSEFRVAAGADPASIRWRYHRADSVRVDGDGSLIVAIGGGELREQAPVLYQESGGRTATVAGRFRVDDSGLAGFEVGEYDHGLPLIIDPVLSFSTYLGGSGLDSIKAMAVDSSGNAYVAGYTDSTDLPVSGAVQPANRGGAEAFVAKLNAAGTALVYCTYLGGAYDDRAFGVAVDASGNAYLTGWTYSSNFPVTSGARQRALSGGRDAFVAKLDATGAALLFSTYLGGSSNDSGNAIRVDASGYSYVAGDTYSTNFPAAPGYQSSNGGRQDAFVAKVAGDGSSLIWSTYLGGAGDDAAAALAIDASGNAYVAGTTGSSNFPTSLALQTANSGGLDAFVAKINATGSSLGFGTYLGGSGGTVSAGEAATAIALDAGGNIYVAGYTSSANFPVLNAYQRTHKGGTIDGFLAKLPAAGTALTYSTYFGGSGLDYINAVAVDAAGMATVAGYTASSNLPASNAVQTVKSGGYDAFLARFNASGATLDFSTYLGGTDLDAASAVVIDGTGSLWVAGQTVSTAFPTLNPIQAVNLGGNSGFVAKFNDRIPTAAFRSTSGNTILMRYGTATLYNALGYVTSAVGVSQNSAGDTYVAGRNDTTCAYMNIFAAATRTWLSGWVRAGCGVYGDPAIAARTGGNATVVARDASFNYYLAEYTAGVGFGAWAGLGGGFATEPVIAAAANGTVYVVGRSSGGVVSAGRYVPGSGFMGWVPAPASLTATGKPAITIGSDGAAYVATRASGTNNTWVIRMAGGVWGSWVNLGGQAKTDPDVAAAGGLVYTAVTNVYDMVYVQALPEGGAVSGQGWVSIGGTLSKAAIASQGSSYAVAGKNTGGALFWYHSANGWSYVAAPGLASSEPVASPK